MDMSYIENNYGVLLAIIAILGMVFGRILYDWITSYRRKREVPLQPQEPPRYAPNTVHALMPETLDENYFDNASRYILSTLQDQKEQAERWIAFIRQESAQISKDHERLYQDFKSQQDAIASKQKGLESKYAYWMNQLKMINTMIENQVQMDVQLKQLK